MPNSDSPAILTYFNSMQRLPLGKQLFSKAVCAKVPYFGTIHPVITELRNGHCEVRMRKRRSVQNHIGTVHAIAMCNLAEVAGGLMTDASVPTTHRWIPKGMTVEYVKKAKTDLVAVASPAPGSDATKAGDYVANVDVRDTAGQTVFRARITMLVGPKKG